MQTNNNKQKTYIKSSLKCNIKHANRKLTVLDRLGKILISILCLNLIFLKAAQYLSAKEPIKSYSGTLSSFTCLYTNLNILSPLKYYYSHRIATNTQFTKHSLYKVNKGHAIVRWLNWGQERLKPLT